MTEIDLFGVKILEPIVVLTDIIVTIVCIWAFINLRKLDQGSAARKMMGWYIIVSGVSTTVGGLLGHGLIYMSDFVTMKFPGWILGMIGTHFFQKAALYNAEPVLQATTFKRLDLLISMLTAIGIGVLFYFKTFIIVEIYLGVGHLLIAMPLFIYYLNKSSDEASRLALIGIAVLASSLLVVIPKLSIGAWISHHDIAHIIMAISIYMSYLAGRAMHRAGAIV